MAEFRPGVDIKTDTPTVEVTVSPNNPLPLGRHVFRLVVMDDSNNASVPDNIEVMVIDIEKPTAVLKADPTVPFGRSFKLDGSASFDVGGGKVTTWLWTYVGPAIR